MESTGFESAVEAKRKRTITLETDLPELRQIHVSLTDECLVYNPTDAENAALFPLMLNCSCHMQSDVVTASLNGGSVVFTLGKAET